MSIHDLTVSHCITCGCEYAIPKTLYERQQQFGGYHTCPNGHSQGWSKDGCENAKLKRERDRLAQQIAQKNDEIADERRQREAAERREKKLKKRVGAGTCPCCNRTVRQMALHMKTKHPEFGKPTLVAERVA